MPVMTDVVMQALSSLQSLIQAKLLLVLLLVLLFAQPKLRPDLLMQARWDVIKQGLALVDGHPANATRFALALKELFCMRLS